MDRERERVLAAGRKVLPLAGHGHRFGVRHEGDLLGGGDRRVRVFRGLEVERRAIFRGRLREVRPEAAVVAHERAIAADQLVALRSVAVVGVCWCQCRVRACLRVELHCVPGVRVV